MAVFGRSKLSILETITRTLMGSPKTQAMRRQSSNNRQNQTFDWSHAERIVLYDEWESIYANSMYALAKDGGFKEKILLLLGRNDDQPLRGWYNPVAPIVDCYQHCVRGQFGREFDIAKEIGPAADRKKVNPEIINPLWRIWNWSNLNDSLPRAQYMAANYGTVGFRIDAPDVDRNDQPIPDVLRRIRIVPIRPHDIVDVILDNQKNVVSALLQEWVNEKPLGSDIDEWVRYEQELTPEAITTRREGKIIGEATSPLGVCPFVLLPHQDIGHPFGVPSHFGTVQILHDINWLFTRLGISVDRHVFAKWFAASGGPPPKVLDLGDTSLAYVQTNPGDTSPKLEAIVAKLDFIGIKNVLDGMREHIRERQPELVLASLESLSGQSGETITKLLTNTEQKILAARGRYEHALVRAQQIALSFGVRAGLWNLGTGSGSAEAADRAYQEGFEDFAYTERPALPPTVFDKTKMAEADNADAKLKAQIAKDTAVVAGNDQGMRVLGMNEAEITKANKSKADNAVPPNTDPPGSTGGSGGL